jgi:hypothetical protein
MKSQYEKDYDNLLQALRDKEDEAAQKERKAEKAKDEEAQSFESFAGSINETGEVWRPEKRHSFDLERFARTKACR